MKQRHYKPRLYGDDARSIDRLLRKQKIIRSQKVSVTITSPPYHDLKNYGSKAGQIGYGQAYDAYLADLKLVFQKVFELTRDDGSLWVVIDTFKRDNELVPLPFDFAEKLKEVGWKLRDIIIWRKDRTVPWSKHGDTRGIFEYVLVFSKGDNPFRYYVDRVREIQNLKRWWVRYPERYNPQGKSPDAIWTFGIPTQGSWSNGTLRHFCPLPSGLVGRILELTTNVGDIVLDPFAGSGSVLIGAYLSGRRSFGVELNRKYVRAFAGHLREQTSLGHKAAALRRGHSFDPDRFQQLILSLRILKFARVLRKRLPRTTGSMVRTIVVTRLRGQPTSDHQIVRASYALFVPKSDINGKLLAKAELLSSKPPLSKFGIEPTFRIVNSRATLSKLLRKQEMVRYSVLNTNSHKGRATIESLARGFNIVSPIAVRISEADHA